MVMIQAPAAGLVKVKRDGPRGWHWISAAHFDPRLHQLVDDTPAPAPTPGPAPAPARKPRAPKSLKEA